MAPASGTGTGSVNYTVAANTASAGRTGTLVVGGQTVTISQAGVPPACAYTVSPLTATYPSAGGSGAVTVATTSACGWTAVSADNWITITSGASGSGNGTVSYSVQANLGLLARSGTLTVAGQTVTISQAGLLGGP